MMKKLFLLACSVLFFYETGAQTTQPIALSSEYDENHNAKVFVSRFSGGLYTVVLQFTNVENLDVNQFVRRRVDTPSKAPLVTLRRIDENRRTSFSYKSLAVNGEVNPRKVDPEFVYRLPFSILAERRAFDLANFDEKFRDKKNNSINYRALQFEMNSRDTVYAARKGIVISVEDEHDPLLGMGRVSMRTKNNEVYVGHPDGTIARYGVLEKGTITVRPGDVVYPGTPIALVGTLDGEKYQLRFSVYYKTDNLGKIHDLSDYDITNVYIDPVFVTSAGQLKLKRGETYTPVTSQELISKEMTKRELKGMNK